jgi:AraC-like DNA-binding protein
MITLRSGVDPGFPLTVYRRDGSRVVHASRLHGHRFFVLFLVDGGTGLLRFSGRTIPVGPGHVHLLAPGELHDTSGLGSITGWAAEFTDEVLEGPGGGLGSILPRNGHTYWVGFSRGSPGEPAHAVVPEADRYLWGRRFEVLQQELTEARLGYREAARALLQLILIHAARLIAPTEPVSAVPPLLSEVFEVIERRFAEPLSLAHVARAVGRSPSHLTSVIRKSTGMTVLEWITERRMAEARRRLRETDEDVAIIAERVGYHDATYFIRQFRKAHQTTPRAFRLAHRVAGDR